MSVNVENKLSDFDHKLDDIEVMLTLLEAKLNSLPPEITSNYPPLTHYSLNDINPVITASYATVENKTESQVTVTTTETNNINAKYNTTPTNPQPNELINEEVNQKPEEELTDEQKLQEFLKENDSEQIGNLYKMLKFEIPEVAVLQKAKLISVETEIVEVSL